ncbi:MAG: hypothetical protein AB1629_07540 [Candidatus Omnitrophota bacterium]
MKDEIKEIRTTIFAIIIFLSLISLKAFKSAKLNVYFCLISLALIFFTLALLRPKFLKPVFLAWTSLFKIILGLLTSIILMLCFYIIISPIGIFLRLFGKDLLDLKLKDRNSYWHKHEEEPVKDRYLKQF